MSHTGSFWGPLRSLDRQLPRSGLRPGRWAAILLSRYDGLGLLFLLTLIDLVGLRLFLGTICTNGDSLLAMGISFFRDLA